MGLLLKQTFPLYAVQVGDEVRVTRQNEQRKQWQRDARKDRKPTGFKICNSWDEVKNFRQEVLTPIYIQKYKQKMGQMLFEAFQEGLENLRESDEEFSRTSDDFRRFFISQFM